MIVRDIVSLTLRLISSRKSIDLYLRMFSRMRSSMTTVSLIEKPAIVTTAATVFRSNCMPVTENRPTVVRQSWRMATTPDRPARQPKRNAM